MMRSDAGPLLSLRKSAALNSRQAAMRLVQIIAAKDDRMLAELSANDVSLVELWLDELETELTKSAQELQQLQMAVEKLKSVKGLAVPAAVVPPSLSRVA